MVIMLTLKMQDVYKRQVQIMFITDLLDETASANALAIGIMGSSNSRYKNISEITAKLNSLYGANINVDIVKQGDFQKLCIGVTSCLLYTSFYRFIYFIFFYKINSLLLVSDGFRTVCYLMLSFIRY